jgi:hypothetical protein
MAFLAFLFFFSYFFFSSLLLRSELLRGEKEIVFGMQGVFRFFWCPVYTRGEDEGMANRAELSCRVFCKLK